MIVLQVALLHLGAALSPGPDILLTMRNSMAHGRAAGCATTAGIITGVALQILLCQLGLVWMLASVPLVFQALAVTGGTFLIYLGISGLREQAVPPLPTPPRLKGTAALSLRRFFRQGLITNLSNPKALLYFLGVYSLVLTADVERGTRIAAGLGMIVVQAAAFLAITHLATLRTARETLARIQLPLIRGLSLVLIFFGARILLEVFTGR